MPLTPNFSAAQSAVSPSIVVLADTSTGSNVAITKRRIYITDFQGVAVVPSGTTTSYIEWPLAQTTINLTILERDMALTIRVDWLDVSNGIINTLTQVFCFSIYTKQFLYYLVQNQGLQPQIVQDNNYYSNLALLWASLKGAINAVELANDAAASQSQLNVAYNLMQNQNLYF